MIFDGRSHLPVHSARSGDSQSVSVDPSTCPSTSQHPASPCPPTSSPLGPPLPASLPSRETCTLPDGPHTSSDLVFSVLPVPLCVWAHVCMPVNTGIGFPWERMGTCNSAESPRKQGSFGYPQPPNRATTAALLERGLIRQRGDDQDFSQTDSLMEKERF